MALTYPLTHAQFLGALRIEEVTFRLSQPQEHTRLGDGSVISASLGAALWTGTIRLAQASHPHHAGMEALIALIRRPDLPDEKLLSDTRCTASSWAARPQAAASPRCSRWCRTCARALSRGSRSR